MKHLALFPHYSMIVPALKRAHTIRVDKELWPSTIPTTPTVTDAERIEETLTKLTERALEGHVAVLRSRDGTVVLAVTTTRNRVKLTNRTFKTINHRTLRQILIEQIGRENFSLPASMLVGRKL